MNDISRAWLTRYAKNNKAGEQKNNAIVRTAVRIYWRYYYLELFDIVKDEPRLLQVASPLPQ